MAQISEIDLFLDANYAELVQFAKANPSDSLELPEFPLELILKATDVANLSKGQLRDHILREASQVVYSQGWVSAGESSHGESSWLRIATSAANLLGDKGHRWLRIALPVTAVSSALLAAVLVHLSRGFGKLTSLGLGFCTASLVPLLASFGARFIATTVSSSQDDPFMSSLLALALSLLRVLQLNHAVFFCLGLAFLAMGFLGAFLLRIRESGKHPTLSNAM